MHGEVLPAEVEEEFEAAVGEAGERFRSPNRTRTSFTLATGWLTATRTTARYAAMTAGAQIVQICTITSSPVI